MAPYFHPWVGFGEPPVAAAARMRGMVDFLASCEGKGKSLCEIEVFLARIKSKKKGKVKTKMT